MSVRWCDKKPPVTFRDGSAVTGAADPRPGDRPTDRPGHRICDALLFAAVLVASLAFVAYAVVLIHT